MSELGWWDPAWSVWWCLALLHSVWVVGLLAGAARWIERRWARRSVERAYGVQVAALALSMVALPAIYLAVGLGGSAGGGPGLWEQSRATVAAAPVSEPGAGSVAFAGSVPAWEGTTAVPAAVSGARADEGAGAMGLWWRVAPWLAGLYVAGVLLMLGRLGAGMFRAHRLAAGAAVMREGPWVDWLRALAAQWSMRAVPALARAERIVTPKVVGLLRPVILIPASALSGLSADELELILAHELAHIRRHDLWVNLLQRLAEALLFFNPGLWILSHRISLLRDYCCDEAAGEGAAVQYARALVRAAELAGAGADAGALSSLAASGRSPSQLRRRVARLFGEPVAESPRLSRSGAAWTAALAILLAAGPIVRHTAAEPEGETAEPASVAEDVVDYEPTIVVARHVLLWDGKEIVTWEQLEARIAALADPTRARPSFYLTGGLREAGGYQDAKDRIWKLHQDYGLAGHSEASLWPRSDLRYDRIEAPGDLNPDERLRRDGVVVDQRGEPVAGAEVVLIPPTDPSIGYKPYHAAMVEGRLRNRLEHVMAISDIEGRFTLYLPEDTPCYLAALQPEVGFAWTRLDALDESGQIILLPWAGLVSELDMDPDEPQHASIRTQIDASDKLPEVVLNQYWSDLNRDEPTRTFHFTHVPPMLTTTVSRDIHGDQGSTFGLPGASMSLLPGETRRLGLGPISDQQRDLLELMRRRPGAPDSESQGRSASPDTKEAVLSENLTTDYTDFTDSGIKNISAIRVIRG